MVLSSRARLYRKLQKMNGFLSLSPARSPRLCLLMGLWASLVPLWLSTGGAGYLLGNCL